MLKIYTVRPGDSLTAIARAAHVALDDLLHLNPQIANPNLIRSGQQIVLPPEVDRSAALKQLALDTYPGDAPAWFKIARREEQDGVSEYETGSNPRIVEYLASCDDLSRADKGNDGTAWCSAFVNWCFATAGVAGTRSASALSWRKWGASDPAPSTGTVVVFRRLQGPEGGELKLVGGHVAFLVEDRGDRLYVLGGNQSDRVCCQSYPKDGYLADTVSGRTRVKHKYELVGFRKPA